MTRGKLVYSRCVLSAILLVGCVPVWGAGQVEVMYDRNLGQISIRADETTLTDLFAQLATKAGIGSRIDADIAGDKISVDQPSLSTTDALQRVLRRYSYTLSYRPGTTEGREVAMVTIMGPAGKVTASGLQRPIEHHAIEQAVPTSSTYPQATSSQTMIAPNMAGVENGDVTADMSAPMSAKRPSAQAHEAGQAHESNSPEVNANASSGTASMKGAVISATDVASGVVVEPLPPQSVEPTPIYDDFGERR